MSRSPQSGRRPIGGRTPKRDQANTAASCAEDKEPTSIPAILTGKQVDRVREALARFGTRKSKQEVAEALEYTQQYVGAVVAGEIACTAHFAGRVAAVVGGELAMFL